MALVFVGDRCGDHSPSSGYDQLCTLFPAAGWLSGRQLVAGHLSWIRRPAGSDDDLSWALFHVFYGDCSGSALPAILSDRWPHATIVSTIHQPVSRLCQDEAALRSLSVVDAIITVCQEQARALAGFGLAASVHVVPHGVWTETFRPAPECGRDGRVLLVGTYLRDWRLTNQVLDRLVQAGVRSLVLGSNAPERIAVEHPLVEVSPRVPEAELARLYHRSAALLLPVLDATASNALLEAMAAGCPVICSRFPSLVEEYLGDDSDAFEPGNCAAAVATLLRYVTDPAHRAAGSSTLIRRAQAFDWSHLRARYAQTYKQIRTRTRQRASAPLRQPRPASPVVRSG
jgi:glycosyltransferase involved in cell wall biosynthesis